MSHQDSEPQKGKLSIFSRTGIDLKGFTVSTFINILSYTFISLISFFYWTLLCHSDITSTFLSSLTYLNNDVLPACLSVCFYM